MRMHGEDGLLATRIKCMCFFTQETDAETGRSTDTCSIVLNVGEDLNVEMYVSTPSLNSGKHARRLTRLARSLYDFR
jgi:hypothetical protein